jgi:hypothetical protein
MEDTLRTLEETTNRIINNINKLMNDASTSEMSKIINNINKDLNDQSVLLKNNISKGIVTSNSEITNSLKKQSNLLSKTGIFQKSTNNIDSTLSKFQEINKSKKNSLLLSKEVISFYNNTKNYDGLNKCVSQRVTTSQFLKYKGNIPSFKTNFNREREKPDEGAIANIILRKEGLAAGEAAWKVIGPIIGGATWIGRAIEALIDAGIEVGKALFNFAVETIDLVNSMGDKLEEIVSTSDDALKKMVKNIGLLSQKSFGTDQKATVVQENILTASRYLVQTLNLPFSPEKIAEVQNAFSELSKTSVAFSETDYAAISQMQQTLDLSAEDVAEITNSFVNIGNSVEGVTDYYGSLLKTATGAGINARKILKDTKDFYNVMNTFRFRGGIDDMTRILTDTKRFKIDIKDMFEMMDTVADPEAAIDLTAQLQALSTDYLGLDPMDILSASMNDVGKFTDMITGPLVDNIDKYFDSKNQKFTQFGVLFSKAFVQMDGVNKVFSDTGKLLEFFKRAGKEKMVGDELKKSPAYIGASEKDKKDMIKLAASYYESGRIIGIDKQISDITTEDYNKIKDSKVETADAKTLISETAKYSISVKDQNDVNKLLIESMMSFSKVIEDVNKGLTSKELKTSLEAAGGTIVNVGLKAYEDDFYKKANAIKEYVGLSTQDIIFFGDEIMGDKGKLGTVGQLYVAAGKAIPKLIPGIDVEDKDIQSDTTKPRGGFVTENNNARSSTQKYSNESKRLSTTLPSFNTNKFGSGVLTQMGGGGNTKVIVSGVIHNKINEKDAGLISGDKVYELLEEHLTK